MILAIDSGGTKTNVAVYDLQGNQQILKKLPGYAVGADSTDPLPELEALLAELRTSFSIDAVAFNIGGKNTGQAEAALRRALPGVPYSVFRESDGYAALEIGAAYRSELVLLAGTGAILVGGERGSDRFTLTGGWGANISDEGSGYSIGLNVLRRCILALDGTGPLSPMEQAVTGREAPFPVASDARAIRAARDQVRARFLPLDRGHIASYAKVAAEYCAGGDTVALELFRDAGAALGRLVLRAADKLALTHVKGVTVTGGLVDARAYWQQAMEDAVGRRLAVDEYHYISDGLMTGTYEIAKKLISQEDRS